MKRPPLATLVALVVFVLAGAGLTLSHHEPRSPLPARSAIHAALGNSFIERFLRGSKWDAARVDPVDPRFDRVTFLAGGRVVAEAEVDGGGVVSRPVNFRSLSVPYGARLAYEPEILLGLCLLFVLMTAVTPWRRVRNLDVLAALSLLAPALVLRAHFVDASTLAALPGLGYLLGRCAWLGLRAKAGPTPPSTPLWSVLTARLMPGQRVRLLRGLVLALGLIFAMVTVSSNGAVDVIFAVMEGATKVIHGVLPYGHLPGDVVHGDTYPILSYALYTPLALVTPVGSDWDSVDLALAFTALVVLLTALAVFRAARPASWLRSGPPVGDEASLRAAIAWLAFPPLLITASTGTTDVLLAALVAVALLAWARPGLSTGLLALAAWFKLAPAALVPLALAPLRGRRLAVAVGSLLAVSAASIGIVVVLSGISGVRLMAHAVAFQFSRGSPQSVWAALSMRGLQPLGQAAVLALVAAAVSVLIRNPELGRDRTRMAALAAAILIGLQLSANYWAFLYLVWVVPLLCMSLLASPEPARAPVPEHFDSRTVVPQPALA